MISAELAEEVIDTVVDCAVRIKGTGHEQYSIGDQQKFERMSLVDLIQYAREEVQDEINYAVMRDIRLRRLQRALHKGFEAYQAEYLGEENAG